MSEARLNETGTPPDRAIARPHHTLALTAGKELARATFIKPSSSVAPLLLRTLGKDLLLAARFSATHIFFKHMQRLQKVSVMITGTKYRCPSRKGGNYGVAPFSLAIRKETGVV